MRKMCAFVAGLALTVTACTTHVPTTDTASKQKDAVAAGQQGHWDSSYGGVDKSYDTGLLQMREVIAPRFQTLTFDDNVTGKTMTYNLFVQFAAGTVTPAGAQGPGAEHMYSFDYAYKLEAVRNWLFQQTKDTSARQLYEKGMASQDD